jgi:hypothetical protein
MELRGQLQTLVVLSLVWAGPGENLDVFGKAEDPFLLQETEK